MKRKHISTQMMVRVAVLAAIAYILFKFLEVPLIAFYKLDLSGVPVLLAGYAMGPLAGILTLAVKDLIAVIGSATGGIGELADFLVLGTLVVCTAVPYQKRRTRAVTIAGMVVGTIAMTIVAMVMNYYVLIPLYQQFMPLEAIVGAANAAVPFAGIDSVEKVIWFATTPFNIIKGIVVCAVTYIAYRYLALLLKQGRLY